MPDPLVAGLKVSQVLAYQGLKATLMKDGQAPATPEVPMIQGRAAMLRVFLAPQDGWTAHEVIVRLNLSNSDAPLEQRVTVSAASNESDLASTVNFDLPAEKVTADLTWSVSLRETQMGLPPETGAEGAIYPAMGSAAFGAKDTGDAEHVVVIPVAYDADGSGRMPDTSAGQLDGLKQRMMQLYPVRAVDITIGDTLHWTTAIKSNGSGWSQLLQAVIKKRLADGVPSNVYYYGMFAPAASFATFCQQGCVLGLSPASPNPDDEYARGSIGLGYLGKQAETDITFVHEVGHAHGRQHAPCQVQDADPDYPYDDGTIGDWGYDVAGKTLLDPAGKSRDLMGYCTPIWISDYTYKALFDRITYLNAPPQRLVTSARYRTILIDGNTAVRSDVVTVRGAGGEVRNVERTLEGQTDQVPARWYPFDHLPGGILLVPADADLGTLRFDGRTVR